MSLGAAITIEKDTATPGLADLMAKTQPARLAAICRDPLRGFWRDHLKNYPRLAGKFAAFPDTGFGEQAADSVQAMIQDNGVLLRADKQGLRLRYRGGTIRPVNARILCFAVAPESYGKTPAEMGFVKGQQRTKAERARFRGMFAFAKQVTFAPNPAVVPSEDEFASVALSAIERSLAT